MRKRNQHFRKSVFLFLFLSVFTLFFSSIVMVSFYRNSVLKSNQAIARLIAVVQEKYPEVEDEEILSILHDSSKTSFFQNYGIDIQNDVVLSSLSQDKMKFFALNIFILLFCFGGFFLVFLWYFFKNRREVQEIIQLIENINHKIYTISLEEHQEDVYSLLKSELYKTTIMLKEQAEHSELEKHALETALSDISHQIKTPLTSILIMLDTITDYSTITREKELEFLNDIRSQVQRIHFLTMSLLRLAQFDAGVICFQKNEIAGRMIIDSVLANLEVLSSSKEVQFEVSGNNRFRGDFKFLEEAFMNILKNSIEASKMGDKIFIDMEDNPVYSKFVFIDCGIGIAREDLIHIFDRFYKTTSASSDSIGIGLSLSKKIIEAHNGRIVCDSEVGKGTTFTIKFMKE